MKTIEMPSCCGVMILPEATLFPHGGMALQFGEERYRKMFHEVVKGDCMMAVANGYSEGVQAGEVAEIGTVGMIRAARVMEDGTIQALLHGIMRVRFCEWKDEREYPYAVVEPVVSYFEPQSQVEGAKRVLYGMVEDVTQRLDGRLRMEILELLEKTEDIGMMSDLISQQFVRDSQLRRELLELPAIADRIPLICEYLNQSE